MPELAHARTSRQPAAASPAPIGPVTCTTVASGASHSRVDASWSSSAVSRVREASRVGGGQSPAEKRGQRGQRAGFDRRAIACVALTSSAEFSQPPSGSQRRHIVVEHDNTQTVEK